MTEHEYKLAEILLKIPNRFILSLAIAKRARQLNEGAKPLVPIEEGAKMHPILTALEEVYANKIEVMEEKEKNDDLEMIEEVERFFDAEVKPEDADEVEAPKKSKKDKDKDKDKEKDKKSKKSLAA